MVARLEDEVAIVTVDHFGALDVRVDPAGVSHWPQPPEDVTPNPVAGETPLQRRGLEGHRRGAGRGRRALHPTRRA